MIVLFNKPCDVLSQFTDREGRRTLADYIDLPGVYAAGRLDRDSEGLLVLTDDARLKRRLTHPGSNTPKTYLVQVEREPDDAAVQALRDGVRLKDGIARAVHAQRIDAPANLWPRDPPIRFRKSVPTGWLRVTLTEGRNRQVRRMTAAAGHPTLRLIRTAVGEYRLGNLRPGESRVL